MQADTPSYYDLLKIHPAAPPELVTAAYWQVAGTLRGQSSKDEPDRCELHELSRAYSVLSDPASRAAYDASIGIPKQPLAPHPRRRRNGLPSLFRRRSRRTFHPACDYYEVIRVHAEAPQGLIDEAYHVMRTVYLRLVQAGSARVDLLDLLEEAYEVTSNPRRRAEYDNSRNGTGSAGHRLDHREAPAGGPATPAVVDDAPPPEAAARPPPVRHSPDTATKTQPARSKLLPRLRTALFTAAGIAVAVTRGAVVAAKAIVLTLLFVPRAIFALFEFAIGLTRSLVDASPRPAAAAVRRVWPNEEKALVRRISESAGRVEQTHQWSIDEATAHVVVRTADEEARFEVTRWPVSVGAGEECDIVLPELAPQQLRLLARDGRLVLYSLSDAPAVLVNGEPVAWSELTTSDSISVGSYTISIEHDFR